MSLGIFSPDGNAAGRIYFQLFKWIFYRIVNLINPKSSEIDTQYSLESVKLFSRSLVTSFYKNVSIFLYENLLCYLHTQNIFIKKTQTSQKNWRKRYIDGKKNKINKKRYILVLPSSTKIYLFYLNFVC